LFSPSSTSFIKILLVIVAIIAVAGVILLFPVNFGNEHTCLLDHITHAAATISDAHTPHEHPSELLRNYLIPYGILWWSSILAMVLVALLWPRRHNPSKTKLHALSNHQLN